MVYEHTDIVIGSSLEAVIYAFNNRYPIFFSNIDRPFRFDFLDYNLDLSFLKLSIEPATLKTFDGDMKVGIPKELLWERLIFLLSLSGLAPVVNICKSIRYDHGIITCHDQL